MLEGVTVSAVRHQGRRDHQEDRWCVHTFDEPYHRLYLFLVCDGHGGDRCASYCIREYPKAVAEILRARGELVPDVASVLRDAVQVVVSGWDDECFGPGRRADVRDAATRAAFFESIDPGEYEANGKDSGCTLTGFVYDAAGRRIYMVNLGDSRTAVYFPRTRSLHTSMDHGVPETIPPGPFGAFVVADGPDRRLCGDLALSRAVGDNTELLTGVVGRTSDTYTYEVGDEACTVVVASDGLWDEISLVDCFLDDRADAAAFITSLGGEAAFHDNVSIILVKIAAPALASGDR